MSRVPISARWHRLQPVGAAQAAYGILLAPLMMLAALPLCAQANLPAPLQITDTNYVHTPDPNNPGFERAIVTFVLHNESSHALVAYSARISGTQRDGTTHVMYGCDADLTDGINWLEGTPGYKPLPPLDPRATRTCRYVFEGKPFTLPTAIAITPLYVVLDDGTVMGDRNAALHSFFEAQRSMAAIYAKHLADLKALDRATPERITSTLSVIANAYQRPGRGVTGPEAKTTSALAQDYAKLQIATALVRVNQLTAGSTDEQAIAQILREHIVQIQRRYENATRYSNPKP